MSKCNIEIPVMIDDRSYTVTITDIGEVTDNDDGSGDVAIDYNCEPDAGNDSVAVEQFLQHFMTSAIDNMIKNEKEKIENEQTHSKDNT